MTTVAVLVLLAANVAALGWIYMLKAEPRSGRARTVRRRKPRSSVPRSARCACGWFEDVASCPGPHHHTQCVMYAIDTPDRRGAPRR